MSHVLSCQLAGGLMIDGIIIEIEALGGLVHCIEKRRQDRGRRVCNARLPIRLASDAPYRNTQTIRVALAHSLGDKTNDDVKQRGLTHPPKSPGCYNWRNGAGPEGAQTLYVCVQSRRRKIAAYACWMGTLYKAKKGSE
jgi:hypothetical protein